MGTVEVRLVRGTGGGYRRGGGGTGEGGRRGGGVNIKLAWGEYVEL